MWFRRIRSRRTPSTRAVHSVPSRIVPSATAAAVHDQIGQPVLRVEDLDEHTIVGRDHTGVADLPPDSA